ncbi:hypothetical protein PINS_up005774 [Pythium insidiosum]|nr:hypothetical protein PINS_up005774 [Pythium insidiosum]
MAKIVDMCLSQSEISTEDIMHAINDVSWDVPLLCSSDIELIDAAACVAHASDDYAASEAGDQSKDERRKHKNREAAARSRQRTRAKMTQLEHLVHDLSVRNHQLEMEIHRLRCLAAYSYASTSPFHGAPQQ